MSTARKVTRINTERRAADSKPHVFAAIHILPTREPRSNVSDRTSRQTGRLAVSAQRETAKKICAVLYCAVPDICMRVNLQNLVASTLWP